MKYHVALLLTVVCLALPAYAPEAQDRPAGESQEVTQNPTTIADKKKAVAALLESAREHDAREAAQDLNKAGQLQLELNHPAEALATFQKSLTLTDQLNDPVIKVDALNGAGAAYLHLSKSQDATPLIQQAITISEQNNYPTGHAQALLLLSDAENRTNHSQALKTAHDALALWETIGDNRGIIRSHVAIALYQYAQDDLEESARTFAAARSLANQSGFKDLEAEAIIYLAFIESRKGAWQDAAKLSSDAGKLVDAEADPEKMMQISTTIAEAYVETGWTEAALKKYEEALQYALETKDPRKETVVRWGVGRIQYFSGKYSEAIATFEDALRQAQSFKEPAVEAMCHEFLGRTYEAKGDHPSALQHLEFAINLYSDSANPMQAARTRGLIGQVYENDGRLSEARQFYQQALERFDRHSDQVNQSATLFALGGLEMKSGNYELAENYLRRSIDTTENMRRMSTSRDLTAAFSATVHDRYEKYIQCLMRNHRDPSATSRVTLAFETSESARARSLTELLRVSDTNLLSNVDQELSKQERALRQALRVKEDVKVSLLRGKYEKAELEKLDAELERLNTEYERTLATINARYPAFGQLTQPQSWNLSRIQKEVIDDDDTLLLEFLLGPDKSYLWAVTRNNITSHELPSQTVIGDAVTKVYNLVKEPKPDTKDNLDQATRELAEMILLPVADQLQKKRIIVAADGALNYIPFQMLQVGADPLVAQHEIINVPSASILGELGKEAARRGVRQKVVAAFGDPVFAEQKGNVQWAQARDIVLTNDDVDTRTIGQLFYAAREISNLVEVASADKAFAATQSQATRERLLNTDLSQFAILHLATHGLLRPSSPENSGLLLSTINEEGKTVDGFVRLQDIYSLRAPVDLVVLSACRTGLGKDIRGEGLIGLTRGFMYAGATSVVASLWNVEDEATAELMKIFYTEMLKNGKTPAEALRLAQNSIRQKPEWSAPHYWAGFVLQGEYRYVVNSSRGWQLYQIVLLVVAVMAVLGAGLYLLLRRKSAKRTKA